MEGFASDPKGRRADSPGEIPALGLRDVAWRLYDSLASDRILLIAAGVTFYLLLSIFPARSMGSSPIHPRSSIVSASSVRRCRNRHSS